MKLEEIKYFTQDYNKSWDSNSDLTSKFFNHSQQCAIIHVLLLILSIYHYITNNHLLKTMIMHFSLESSVWAGFSGEGQYAHTASVSWDSWGCQRSTSKTAHSPSWQGGTGCFPFFHKGLSMGGPGSKKQVFQKTRSGSNEFLKLWTQK